jgi:DNA-binding transcriptional LysR family regulator
VVRSQENDGLYISALAFAMSKVGIAVTDSPRVSKRSNALQTRRELEWSELAVILAIGRAGSLSGAARALGKTHSTVFRNIRAIEEKTGVRFFDSVDHGYVPTEAGRVALEHAERVENEFHALGIKLLGLDARLSGRVRITCPEAFASEHAPGLVARFVGQHPDVRVDVSPGHGALDLNRREAEIAIRATKVPPETAIGRKICPFRFALSASPDYLETAPERPLAEHAVCLIEGTVNWLVPTVWRTKEQGENRAVFQCRASRAVQNACAAGPGGSAFCPATLETRTPGWSGCPIPSRISIWTCGS